MKFPFLLLYFSVVFIFIKLHVTQINLTVIISPVKGSHSGAEGALSVRHENANNNYKNIRRHL